MAGFHSRIIRAVSYTIIGPPDLNRPGAWIAEDIPCESFVESNPSGVFKPPQFETLSPAPHFLWRNVAQARAACMDTSHPSTGLRPRFTSALGGIWDS